MKHLVLLSLALVALMTGGCATYQVKSTNTTPVVTQQTLLNENQLLDVAIVRFDPGEMPEEDDENTLYFAEIRKAESQYFPFQLMQAMQKSAAWGPVRIVPQNSVPLDLNVTGKILSSDGEKLRLWIHAFDASGRTWLEKEYESQASRYAYDPKYKQTGEPFLDLYNRIANDLLQYRQQLNEQQVAYLHELAALRFASEFSPQVFGDYVKQDSNGYVSINRLPASGDNMMQRLQAIRERDQMYIDTLQEYYSQYAREMTVAYRAWRGQSYQEVIAMRELQEESRKRIMLGAAAILGGVLGAGSPDAVARAASYVGVAGGGYMLKSGMDKADQAQIHVDALLELGESLEASIAPQSIELEDRTVTLSGTVDDQYQQWKALLREIYQLERGQSEP
ncbi:hypothetical protein KJY73_05925 [Bowmanella sp. Y26]|uniref:hypothetical protein n=1 Tax=Bowmanella yangjiangensis TaxID=2811230 RepID=UPI001BDD50EA|nr:hypothetical protein [Bowmanella yangjiangensis]MBT1063105.1 hypothetical protein [Bowmanella yangjiangensis]